MVLTIGDIAQSGRLLNQIGKTQDSLDRVQIQLSTGAKAEVYSEISGNANRLLLVENAFVRTQQFNRNIQGVQLRTEMMDSTLTQMVDLATEFKSLLLSATSAENYNEFDVDGQAQDLLERFSNLLNVEADGKYLFAGTATTTQPSVVPSPLTAPSNAGTSPAFTPEDPSLFTPADPEWQDFYGFYQGNNGTLSVRIAEDQVINYGITANEQPFVDLMYSLRLAATFNDGSDPGSELARLNSALDSVTTAVDGIIDRQSRLGQQMRTVDMERIRNEDTIGRFSDLIGEIEATNIPEAATQLSQFQTQLEASYLVTTRLRQASIINFLN